jgi:carboxymethylenebutenolidase
MCHSDASRPPLPPIRGAATDDGPLELHAADGNRLQAYAARAQEPSGSGMVVMPDVRGLHQFYKDLAVRFAEAGFQAVAIDYFGRTADTDDRQEGFDWMTHVKQLKPEGVAADVAAGVAHLKGLDRDAPRAIFTVGFCMGGRESWRQSAMGHGLGGVIGFYGGQPKTLIPQVGEMKAPLLMLLAGEDGTPAQDFRDFEAALKDGGVEFESHTYPGAPHSFFDRSFSEHAAACDDAWRRILDFTERHTPA